MSREVRHLYVHLPFCRHRCGYCDFVTVVGKRRRPRCVCRGAPHRARASRVVFSRRARDDIRRRRDANVHDAGRAERLLDGLPEADEVTVEANPETVTPALARLLRDGGVTRVSLGAQSFEPELLDVLDRSGEAGRRPDAPSTICVMPDFDNISLDLIYGIPRSEFLGPRARSRGGRRDSARSTCSCYELEAKPGTRFTHAHGEALEQQAEAMEGYFELVVETARRLRLSLVRDGELLSRALRRGSDRRRRPQPRLLAGQGLPRDRHRGGLDRGGAALAQPSRASLATCAALGRG